FGEAASFVAKIFCRGVRAFGFGCVHTDQAHTFARAKQEGVTVHHTLNVFNVRCSAAGIGWVEECNKERNKGDTSERQTPGTRQRTHGAFSMAITCTSSHRWPDIREP